LHPLDVGLIDPTAVFWASLGSPFHATANPTNLVIWKMMVDFMNKAFTSRRNIVYI